MIPQEFEYSAPSDLGEALALLAQGAKPLSGGQSLVPAMKLRLAMPTHLVDLTRIRGLNGIREDGGRIHIGALATHYEIESSPLLRDRCPVLVEVAHHIGDIQVRNLGTIGGSAAHADPAADYPAALFCLGAQFQLASAKGERTLEVQDFFLDTFTTALDEGEIVSSISVPAMGKGSGYSYKKMVQPASGFAIVGVAVVLRKEGGRIAEARVGVTGLGPKAFRASGVEQALNGKAGSAEELTAAARNVATGVDANSDLHASSDYRRAMSEVYTARALREALSRAA